MNKINIIKIVVPIVVLGGILAIIIATQKPVEKMSFQHIDPFDFNAYVDEYIADSIINYPRAVSEKAYENLYEIIATESSIMATNISGEKEQLLSQTDAEDCYERAFKAFFSVFSNDANRVFGGSSWSNIDLNNIETSAKDLLNRKGISSSQNDSLARFIKYVGGYNSAIKLLYNSQYCSNLRQYNSYCEKAKAYSGYPYQNNSKLKNMASDVAGNARNGWQSSIESKVNDICGRHPSDYNSHNEFYENYYKPAYDNIEDYCNKFNTSWGEASKKKLDKKNTEVRDFYNNKPDSGNSNF